MALIGRLFDSEDHAKVQLIFDRAQELAELERKVGTEGFRLRSAQLQSQRGDLKIFNQPFKVGGELQVDARIHPADARLSFFDQGETFGAGKGRSFAEFALGGKFEASGEGHLASAPLLINAQGGTSGEIHYRHVIPVQASQKRRSALHRVVKSSKPPQVLPLADLVPGEAHELQAQLNISFGIDLRSGSSVDIDELIQPFRELDLNLKAHVEFSIEASLGWSFYDSMNLSVGRACTLNRDPSWVRIRLDRQRRNQLSLGARFHLDVEYDLAIGVERLYDRALALIPTGGVIKTFKEVNEILASGNWEDVKERLSERGVAYLTDYLDGTGWREWVAEESAKFVKFSQQVVQAYDRIDDRLQGWWGELLASAGLGADSSMLPVIKKIAAIDPDRFRLDALLDEEGREMTELLEALTGKRLEELLLGSDVSVKPWIERAKKTAQSALDFLDKTPERFVARLQNLAEKSGVARVVDFLRQNATNKNKLEKAIESQVENRVRLLVARLVGKAWEQIEDKDLERVQRWAERIQKLLDRAEDWRERIRKEIRRLQGEVGFSVGLEFDRLSQSSALLDVEIDPRDERVVHLAEKALVTGSVKKLLDGLYQRTLSEGDEEGEGKDEAFQIREAVFLSRRVRTTKLSVWFFGSQANGGSRVRETAVRILSESGQHQRHATYTGAYLRIETSADTPTNEAGAWLQTTATGHGLDLDADYDQIEHELRLTFSRLDVRFEEFELEAVGSLLSELGFREADAADLDADRVGMDPQGHLAIELSLPTAAIEVFFDDVGKAGRQAWEQDYLNAARRWFSEPLIAGTLPELKPISLGSALAALLQDPNFRKAWRKGQLGFREWAKLTKVVRIRTLNTEKRLRFFKNQRRVLRVMNPLEILASKGRTSLANAQEIRQKLLQAKNRGSVTNLNRLHKAVARRFGKIQANKWENPMFLWWLFLARIARRRPEVLSQVRGVASLRFREDTEGTWTAAQIWRLEKGLSDHLRQDLLEIR